MEQKDRQQETMDRHEAVMLAGMDMLHALRHLEGINPQLSRFLLQDGFGDTVANTIIGYREWALLTLATLMAVGDTGDQLEMYLKVALQNGATDDEILDVVNLACLYVGGPRAVNATRRLTDPLAVLRSERLPATTEMIVHRDDHDTVVWDRHTDGPPILLIHALSLDHRMWRKVYSQLAKVGRVIAYDLRGHGRARRAPRTMSLDHLAADTRLLLDALGIEQADVYGASYGGAVA